MEPTEPSLAPDLRLAAMLGTVGALDDAIAHVDGVLNLSTKAVAALDRGAPGDRERALSLIDRALRFLPDERDLPPERRTDLPEMRAALENLRARALALPE